MTAPDDVDLAQLVDGLGGILPDAIRRLLRERDAARESERRLREAVEEAARDIRAHRTAFMPDGADHCEVAANAAFTTAAEIVLDALDQTGQETT